MVKDLRVKTAGPPLLTETSGSGNDIPFGFKVGEGYALKELNLRESQGRDILDQKAINFESMLQHVAKSNSFAACRPSYFKHSISTAKEMMLVCSVSLRKNLSCS